MSLILFGFKRCGKTFYGKQLAEELDMPFIDTDALIELKSRQTVSQLYNAFGEEHFRCLEKAVVHSLNPKKPSIISLGAGAVLNPDNLVHLQSIGLLTYLKTPKSILKKRIFSSPPLPSYLDSSDPQHAYETMYVKRLPIYESIPSAVINTCSKNDNEILQELKNLLLNAPWINAHYG